MQKGGVADRGGKQDRGGEEETVGWCCSFTQHQPEIWTELVWRTLMMRCSSDSEDRVHFRFGLSDQMSFEQSLV